MPRLKDATRQIPHGLQYRIPELNWDSTKVLYPMPSLRVLSEAVQQARRGNPHATKTHGWRMDIEGIEAEVNIFNAQRCLDHGWLDFVTMESGGPPPKSLASLTQNRVKSVAAGLSNLSAMLGEGGAVKSELANSRAATCATCPQNSKGDWMRFFTVPASEMIRKMTTNAEGAGLKTSFDDQLQICQACLCPLKLKVHAQMQTIRKHMDEETKSKLDQRCWVLSEA